jgi:alkanesulfonate monooxygenase SsuD/methylene tetrahydromethanopterin reductase-like flavin-dependent oxidoreductase (luciferase family)
MEFGIFAHTRAQNLAGDFQLAEDRGFTHAWFPDVPMSMADMFAAMGVVAASTRRINICAGVAITSNRSAAVTANAIATVNALAPGRVILGYGSGSFTRDAQGLRPLRVADVRKHLDVIRALLRDGAAVDESEGSGRKIRFFNRGEEMTALTPGVPVYIAASAPRMAMIAAEVGDGLINAGLATPEAVTELLNRVRGAGARAGHRIGNGWPVIWEAAVCVLRPGETLESTRVVARVGWWVMLVLKFLAKMGTGLESAPPGLRSALEEYNASLVGVPHDELHLGVYEGHHTLPAHEKRFVTPDSIRATTQLIAARDELIDRIRELRSAGVTQIAVAPGFGNFRETADEISRELIGRV